MESRILVASNIGNYELSEILFIAENDQDAIDFCKEHIRREHARRNHGNIIDNSFVVITDHVEESRWSLFNNNRFIELSISYTYEYFFDNKHEASSHLFKSKKNFNFFLIELPYHKKPIVPGKGMYQPYQSLEFRRTQEKTNPNPNPNHLSS